MIIAVDGPSGAGKSSVCKLVSEKLNFEYLDTGAMYRACAYKMFISNVDINEENAKKYIANIDIDYKDNNIYLEGKVVEDKIRTPDISRMASEVSKIPFVREVMVDLQRKIASKKDVIVDGRDIGTVVFPNADLKVFVTASPEIRGRRRYEQLLEQGKTVDLETIIEEVRLRDKNDMTRKISPLKIADDAIVLDNSDLELEESAERLTNLILQRRQEINVI